MEFELCHPGGRVRAGVAGARVAGSDPSAGAVVSCQSPREAAGGALKITWA